MRALIAAAFVLCSSVPSAAATWTEIRTPHYTFLGDASRGDMRRIAERFELFHGVMQRLLARGALSFSVPTVVVVFANDRSMRPYVPTYEGRPVDIAGWASSGSHTNYVAINAEHGERAYPVVFHELTHLISQNLSQNVPTWFAEGIAEYYSSFELRGDKSVMLGIPLWQHLQLLHDRFLPLEELLAVDRESASYNESDRANVFYAQSWALVHFLRSNQQLRGRFRDYMKLADGGLPQEQAIAQGFGMELGALEQALRSYVRQFRMSAELIPLKEAVGDSELKMADAPQDAVMAHLAGLLLTLGRTDDAEERLRAAVESSPRSAVAHAMLARVRLEQNRATDALSLIDRELTYSDFLDHFLIASVAARYLGSVDSSGSDGTRAAALLRRTVQAATAARSDVPDAWRLAAHAHLLAKEPDAAHLAITRALSLAPANESYRFMLADVLVEQRDFKAARSILGMLMSRGSAEVRENARRMMAAVVRYERDSSPEAMFRVPKQGETRVFGQLTALECSHTGITSVVQIDARTLRVTVPSIERLEFITYREDLKGQVTCEARTPHDPVYLTWSGADTGAAEIRAEAAVVEFTPRDYKPR